MSGDEVVLDGLLDEGHVTGGALAAGAVGGVVGVLGDGAFDAGGIVGRVAGETELVAGCDEIGLVLR